MEYVEFGNTGLHVSRLCFGTGTHGWGYSSQQSDLGVNELARLLRLAYDHGVNFWDSADQYGTHPHVARALQDIPRESVVLATKTYSRTAKDVSGDVERFLKELHTDWLDIVLLHFVTSSDWTSRYVGAMEALSCAKEAGKIRAVGVSCHGFGSLQAAAESDWPDVALVRINPAGVNMDATPSQVAPVIQRMYHAGKAVYAMKVLGCGALAHDARSAIEYVLKLGTVYAMTIGMSTEKQLMQNIELVGELAPSYRIKKF